MNRGHGWSCVCVFLVWLSLSAVFAAEFDEDALRKVEEQLLRSQQRLDEMAKARSDLEVPTSASSSPQAPPAQSPAAPPSMPQTQQPLQPPLQDLQPAQPQTAPPQYYQPPPQPQQYAQPPPQPQQYSTPPAQPQQYSTPPAQPQQYSTPPPQPQQYFQPQPQSQSAQPHAFVYPRAQLHESHLSSTRFKADESVRRSTGFFSGLMGSLFGSDQPAAAPTPLEKLFGTPSKDKCELQSGSSDLCCPCPPGFLPPAPVPVKKMQTGLLDLMSSAEARNKLEVTSPLPPGFSPHPETQIYPDPQSEFGPNNWPIPMFPNVIGAAEMTRDKMQYEKLYPPQKSDSSAKAETGLRHDSPPDNSKYLPVQFLSPLQTQLELGASASASSTSTSTTGASGEAHAANVGGLNLAEISQVAMDILGRMLATHHAMTQAFASKAELLLRPQTLEQELAASQYAHLSDILYLYQTMAFGKADKDVVANVKARLDALARDPSSSEHSASHAELVQAYSESVEQPVYTPRMRADAAPADLQEQQQPPQPEQLPQRESLGVDARAQVQPFPPPEAVRTKGPSAFDKIMKVASAVGGLVVASGLLGPSPLPPPSAFATPTGGPTLFPEGPVPAPPPPPPPPFPQFYPPWSPRTISDNPMGLPPVPPPAVLPAVSFTPAQLDRMGLGPQEDQPPGGLLGKMLGSF